MNRDFVEDLKSKISILAVISSRMRLRRSGHDWFGICPFHKEKTGSFKVDETRGFYYCFGCGTSGDAIKFVMDFDKISFQEAVEKLATQFGVQLPQKTQRIISDPNMKLYEIMNFARDYFSENLYNKNGEKALEYLNMRGIQKEFMEKFQLGFAPNNSDLYKKLRQKNFSDHDLIRTGIFLKPSYGNELIDRYKSRLMFPIIDAAGKCVGFGGRILDKSDKAKYINSPETEIYTKSNQLYGYNLARKGKSRRIVIMEGYLDVISMHQAGFDGAVATLGTSISETQINMCWKICNNPVVALDGDSAGIKASYRWIDKILLHLEPGKSFNFAAFPQGTDPDILVYNQQIETISNALDNAQPLSDWLWEGSFSLFPSQTPEQKAEIIQAILKKVETIKDTSVKSFYVRAIKEKERSLFYGKRKKTVKKENLLPAKSAKEKIEKILIVTIINHPYIIDQVVEDFAKIEFHDFRMKKMRDKILKSYYAYASESKQMFVDQLAELKKSSEDDFKEASLHASFVDMAASDEEAANGWFKLLSEYLYKPSLDQDLQKTLSDFNFSESNWQKLKALKKEALLSRGRK